MSDLTRRPHCQKLKMTGFVTTNRVLRTCNRAWRASKRISRKTLSLAKLLIPFQPIMLICYYNEDACNYWKASTNVTSSH